MEYKTRLTLMERLKNAGDEKSWDEFNNVYRRYIYSIVKSMYVEESRIDDLIQDVLISVWKALPGFEYNNGKGRFSSWLATITVNKVKSAKLQKSRQINREHKAYKNQDSLDGNDLEKMFDKEWAAFLTRSAWENISQDLSETMKLCFEGFMDGKKIKEIADELELPENTVSIYKRRVSTIMKREIHRLREELD